MIPEYEDIKRFYGHLFDIDSDTGNMTLKKGFFVDGRELPLFTMVFVRGGEFVMGDGSDDDNPPHKVRLSSFFIGQTPVTQELYEAVLGENPSNFKGRKRPVEQVSWYDSINFCRKLNKVLSLPNNIKDKGEKTEIALREHSFRLPTEAEWEYAARGGERGKKDNYKYSGSNDVDLVAWYEGNNEYETKPVGLKLPNQLGLYDMSGNVWEWCVDWYDSDFYRKGKGQTDPCNQSKGLTRVVRGGSWHDFAAGSRVVYRYDYNPEHGWRNYGFRLVLPF